MSTRAARPEGFDGAAAMTRSLLGWGVVAGAFYLVIGLVLALTRAGFSFSEHPLSLLMLGEHGWMQRANLGLTGLMVLSAGVGLTRGLHGSRRARAGWMVTTYGGCLVLSAVFPPDPVAGFPPGAATSEATVSGILHLIVGAIGFLSLAAAAAVIGGWFTDRADPTWARYSRASALVVGGGFAAGAALATTLLGVAALWVAVVAGWAWLALASIQVYRAVLHPDLHRRPATDGSA